MPTFDSEMKTQHTILVTGGAGYIGSHTVIALAEAGYLPVILDDFRNAEPEILTGMERILGFQVPHYDGSCQDSALLERIQAAHPLDGIIHFAADKAVGESVVDPLKYYDNNLSGLVQMLQFAVKHQVAPFVFSSSCTVYGNPFEKFGILKVNEETPTGEPESPYGRTKWIGEMILTDVVAAHPVLKVAGLRYFNPVGAHASGWIGEAPQGIPNNLLPYITQTATGQREKLTVFGNDYATADGTCIRDYIHVVDVAEAHVAAVSWLLQQQAGLIDFINIGTGIGTSVLEMIEGFEAVTGQKLNWEFGPKRPGDVPQIFAEVGKAQQLLGWHAKRTVQDALADAWRWEQNRQKNA